MPGLAQACEHAALTVVQAEAARLAGSRWGYRAIATSLNLPYPKARGATRAAARKLAAANAHLVAAQRRELVEVLHCLRNRRSCRNAGIAVYAPMPEGGWEAAPVRIVGRADGELPEDLLDDPLRFLVELARQLHS